MPASSNLYDTSYFGFYKTPAELGITETSSLTTDISGIQPYVNALTIGSSNANKDPPLLPGTRYFIDTNTTCLDASNTSRHKSILIDGVLENKLNDQKGLMYSMFASLDSIDTSANMFNALKNDPGEKCESVSVYANGRTDGKKSTEIKTGYVSKSDKDKIDPSAIKSPFTDIASVDQVDDITRKSVERAGAIRDVSEGERLNSSRSNGASRKSVMIDNDIITQFYFTSITLLGLYMFYRLYDKHFYK